MGFSARFRTCKVTFQSHHHRNAKKKTSLQASEIVLKLQKLILFTLLDKEIWYRDFKDGETACFFDCGELVTIICGQVTQ